VYDRNRIAALLRGLRAEKDLTLAQVERKIGIDASTISRTENGERELKLSEFVAFCEFFGKPFDYFLT
jgi:transcriptional regulator with XRE-family HTH domain